MFLGSSHPLKSPLRRVLTPVQFFIIAGLLIFFPRAYPACDLEHLKTLPDNLRAAFEKNRHPDPIPHGYASTNRYTGKTTQGDWDQNVSSARSAALENPTSYSAQQSYAATLALRGQRNVQVGNFKKGYEDLNEAGDKWVEVARHPNPPLGGDVNKRAEEAFGNARYAYLQAGEVSKALKTYDHLRLSPEQWKQVADYDRDSLSRFGRIELVRTPYVEEMKENARTYYRQLSERRSNFLMISQLYVKAGKTAAAKEMESNAAQDLAAMQNVVAGQPNAF